MTVTASAGQSTTSNTIDRLKERLEPATLMREVYARNESELGLAIDSLENGLHTFDLPATSPDTDALLQMLN